MSSVIFENKYHRTKRNNDEKRYFPYVLHNNRVRYLRRGFKIKFTTARSACDYGKWFEYRYNKFCEAVEQCLDMETPQGRGASHGGQPPKAVMNSL